MNELILLIIQMTGMNGHVTQMSVRQATAVEVDTTSQQIQLIHGECHFEQQHLSHRMEISEKQASYDPLCSGSFSLSKVTALSMAIGQFPQLVTMVSERRDCVHEGKRRP